MLRFETRDRTIVVAVLVGHYVRVPVLTLMIAGG